MSELQPPVALQNVSSLNADDFRGLIQALVPTEGIIASGDLAVVENGTPNMSVNVGAGAAIIAGDDTPTTQGSYFVKNDATKNLTVTAADPTNPRKDIVVARVRDAFYSGSDNDWLLAVVAGTPAASPAEPSLPNDALKLAVITVAAAATTITNAAITDSRTLATPLGATADAAWTAYTPTLQQGVTTVAKTITYARYEKKGRTVTVNAVMTCTGAGSANNTIKVGLPFAAATISALRTGMFSLRNASGPNNFVGACYFFSTTSVCGITNNNSEFLGAASSAFSSALASGDVVSIDLIYEASA